MTQFLIIYRYITRKIYAKLHPGLEWRHSWPQSSSLLRMMDSEKQKRSRKQRVWGREWSGLFSMPLPVRILMISLILSLSLKLFSNSLVYDPNIFVSSSIVFGNLWKSSDIFGNLQKFSENVWQHSCDFQTNFGESLKSSESGQKSSENRQKRHQDMNLCSHGKKNFSLVRCSHSWDMVRVRTLFQKQTSRTFPDLRLNFPGL